MTTAAPTVSTDIPVPDAVSAATYKIEVFSAGVWAEVDRFSDDRAARIFAERLVRVTRHEVARIALVGVRVGDVAGVDTVLDIVQKPPPKQIEAEKRNTAKAAVEDFEQWRRRWRRLILYGGSAFLGLLVLYQFGDKLKKVAAFLIG
jgi:hypothetical protein